MFFKIIWTQVECYGLTPMALPFAFRLSDGADAPEAVSRDDLAARIAEGSGTILDVRTAVEFGPDHIPGAKNVALNEWNLIAYCRGLYCIYAYQAVAALREMGCNGRRLDGGLPEWREEGRQVVTV